ncbi:MAG: glycosyltransferase [Nakamurella sp.]
MTAPRTAGTVPVTDHPSVVHIITALGTGGAERQLESLVTHSAGRSRTIALYDGGVVADAMRAAGHRVDELGLGSRTGVRKLLAVPALLRLIREDRPDIVHVHLLAAQLWGIPSARLAGVRHVLSSEHSLMDTTIESRPLTPMLRRVYRVLERLTSHTVAVSETTRSRLLRWGIRSDRISVVDNGIDFDRLAFSAADREIARGAWGVGPGTTVVGAVGRLEPVKRFPALLDALAPWLRTGDRHLVLVGDGPLKAALIERAAALGVADLVHVLGARPDIPALLSGLDILISPSRDETFGMAVVEALGAGLPVVYAQCPALDELSAPLPTAHPLARYGMTVGSPDADTTEGPAIIAALTAVLAAPAADRSGTATLPTLRDAYGIDRAAASIDALYRKLTG